MEKALTSPSMSNRNKITGEDKKAEANHAELCNFFVSLSRHINKDLKTITIMILTTTPTIEGHTIREYKGLVTGETIIGANIVKDFFAGIRDVVGGRSASYEQVLREAKDTSLKEMMERAQVIGANAVVGIDIDYETIGSNGSMLMVSTSGTAVVI